MVKVSWNSSGEEGARKDGGVMKGGVMVLFVVATIVLSTEDVKSLVT